LGAAAETPAKIQLDIIWGSAILRDVVSFFLRRGRISEKGLDRAGDELVL